MEVKVNKFMHQGQEMYVTVLSGKTIASISDVDSVDKDAKTGYQRPRNPARCKNMKDFIENTKGLIPGAILLNVRPEQADELHFSKLGGENGIEFGTVDFPNDKFSWIMDGQHRVGGFELLSGDILVPVVMTVGMSRAKEAETFNIVNGKQQNVSPSLNYYDLVRYAEPDVKKWAERDKLAGHQLAYDIVVDLNREEPWKDRVNVTGVRGMKRAINLNGFMNALEPVVKDRWFATLQASKQLELMRTFWSAMVETWPLALAHDNTSALTKTFGVHVACGIAIDIFLDCDRLKDSSKESMVRLLAPTKPIVGDWDLKGPLQPFIGGGRKNVAFVTETLRAEIRKAFEEIISKQPVQPA